MHIPEHIHSQIGSRSLSRDLLLFLAVGKHQQRLLMFYNISAYVTVSLSLPARGKAWEGLCERLDVQRQTVPPHPPTPNRSCLNASLLARLNHMCIVLS